MNQKMDIFKCEWLEGKIIYTLKKILYYEEIQEMSPKSWGELQSEFRSLCRKEDRKVSETTENDVVLDSKFGF